MAAKGNLDSLDKHLIQLLAEDGRMPVKELTERLNVTTSTVHTRIKRLLNKGVLKIAGLVDVFKVEGIITAIVAIRVSDDSEMNRIIDELMSLNKVLWAVAVTGQYDIFAEVAFTKGTSALYSFVTEELPRIGGIRSSESFVVMKSTGRWIQLPRDLDGWTD